MTVTKFDRATLRTLGAEIDAAIAAVAAKHGLSVSRGSSRFTPERATLKIDLVVTASTGSDNPGQPADFASKAARLGLPTDCWGKTFTSGRGTRYTITEINLRRRKYPVSATGPKGGRYKFPAADVLRGL